MESQAQTLMVEMYDDTAGRRLINGQFLMYFLCKRRMKTYTLNSQVEHAILMEKKSFSDCKGWRKSAVLSEVCRPFKKKSVLGQ